MAKIKDIVVKMKTNGTEYQELSFLVSKRVWLAIATLYYVSYLFTVGGFYFGPVSLDYFSMITFHLYSVLVIATAWFFYSICEYSIAMYVPGKKWLLVFPIIIGIAITSIALLTHLWVIWDLSTILSLIK